MWIVDPDPEIQKSQSGSGSHILKSPNPDSEAKKNKKILHSTKLHSNMRVSDGRTYKVNYRNSFAVQKTFIVNLKFIKIKDLPLIFKKLTFLEHPEL